MADDTADPVRLLILGAGGWAATHASTFAEMDDAVVVAAVDNRPDVLAAFLETHGIARGFASLEEALRWGDFDAASNVTPDAVHHATTLALLAAGKHVLCEKPLATDHARAREMAAAASASGLVNMVNLRYRGVPALQKARQLVEAGRIGAVRHFEASYLQSWLVQDAWGDWRTDPGWLWRLSSAHGSNGVLGDVGIHILDFATYVAGSLPVHLSCRLKTFPKAAGERIGDYVLDANDGFVMTVELADGAVGTIGATRYAPGHHNDLRLRLYGDAGALEVRYEKRASTLAVCLGEDVREEVWREMATEEVPSTWRQFVTAVRDGTRAEPDFERGAALQAVLDRAVAADREARAPRTGSGAVGRDDATRGAGRA